MLHIRLLRHCHLFLTRETPQRRKCHIEAGLRLLGSVGISCFGFAPKFQYIVKSKGNPAALWPFLQTSSRSLGHLGTLSHPRLNITLIDHIMIFSLSVRITHQVLEWVFQGSQTSSSSSAEQLQPTGSSLGVHREQSVKIDQGIQVQRRGEAGQLLRLQNLPVLEWSEGPRYGGGALTQKNITALIRIKGSIVA